MLNHLRLAVNNKWDGVCLIDGIEGSGKSNLALLSAFYLDPSFNLDRVVFTPKQFIDAVEKASVGQAIVWDEFITGGLSNDFMTEMQRSLVKKMTMIRKKRLYILWVLPYFFIAGKYFAVARSRFLLHSFTPDGIQRGYFKVWNYDRKRRMYFRGKREMDYCVDPYKTGTFKDFFKTYPGLMNEKEYDHKKEEATKEVDMQQEQPKIKRIMEAMSRLVTVIRKSGHYTPKELAEITGYTRTWIYEITDDEYKNGDDDG